MPALKTMIKKTARYFGFEISRYTKDRYHSPLFNCWINKLQSTDPLYVVFDVGANRGQTVARFRAKFPDATIYAFEPGVPAFSKLRAVTANDPKTKLFHLALGEHDGSATLHENANDVTNSLLPNSRRISQFSPPELCVPKNKSTVPLMRIDTFCAKESIDRIDLLKIDAQGYEQHILDGAGSLLTPATIRGLFLEVLFVDLYENQTWCGEVLESLRSRGYRLFGFTGIDCDDTHGWKWADAMFIGDS
jgi:FkbM family methyltransferase